MHITHWVPTSSERPPWPCISSWLGMEVPEGASKKFVRGMPGPVSIFWNKVVKDFLDTKSDWLFSTHMDVVFEPETLVRLLSWDKPLVSGLVFMRHSPVVPHVWKSYEGSEQFYTQRINDTRNWFYNHKEYVQFGPYVMKDKPEDALIPVSFTSTSCTLIHRTVLEDMVEFVGEEWFKCDSEVSGGGEDRRFFENALLAGYEAYVDRSVVAGHVVGDIATSSADFIAWDSVSTFNDTGEPPQKLETPVGDGG